MARQPHPPGMDHRLYRFSPLPARPPLAWPGGARVALMVVLYLEHWELAPPEASHRDPRFRGEFGSFFPDYRTYSQREYGNRVGAFRVLEALDRHGLPATVAADAATCRRCPELLQACRQRGWELAAHGTHATRMITARMDEAEERGHIAEATAALADAAGRAPAGWIGQDFGESARTPALLAEAGFRWLGDWPNDEQPYRMTVGTPPLVSLPAQPEWDDVQLLWLRRIAMPRYPAIVRDACARLCADGAASGRLLALGLHPWLIGQPHRIRYLDEALAALARQDGIWPATGSEIADAYLVAAGRA